MKAFYGYIRVSTAKQGEGVSLPQQKDAIERHAEQNGYHISQWFEERVTAAKRGRPVFANMLKLLKAGKAAGVIIHKIDRSARNLRDWADLIDLSDSGVEVQMATENLDLRSRGGRLSADIQAVVAADYIRNLREETRKGFYGRLKQGFYPLPAPIGYLDRGKAQAKVLDVARAPLVKKAFELYATGRYSLIPLLDELTVLGLRNRAGKPLSMDGLSVLLNNPFYMGLIRIRRTGELYQGVHQPLIPKTLFDRVQRILRDKTNTRSVKHALTFRRLIRCGSCGYCLIGETQKGHRYYRCHTRTCPTTGIREELIEKDIISALDAMEMGPEEWVHVLRILAKFSVDWAVEKKDAVKACDMRMANIQERLARLTDAYIDRTIDKELFEDRKAALLNERAAVNEQRAIVTSTLRSVPDALREFLELARRAKVLYQVGISEEKRDLLKLLTSNRVMRGKNVVVELSNPFADIANMRKTLHGAPRSDIPRTWEALLPKLADVIATLPNHVLDAIHDMVEHSVMQE